MAPYLFLDGVHHGKKITLFGDGSTSRDYTYVTDIAQGVIAAHDKPHRFEIFNLGNNSPVTLLTFVKTIETVTGKKAKTVHIPIQPGDVERTWADISKAQKLLGYKPNTSLAAGLEQTYAWYKEEIA